MPCNCSKERASGPFTTHLHNGHEIYHRILKELTTYAHPSSDLDEPSLL